MQATRQALDSARWHFQHGPIDLVIAAEGQAQAVAQAMSLQLLEQLPAAPAAARRRDLPLS